MMKFFYTMKFSCISFLAILLVFLASCDQEHLSHQLNVINGSGSGEYLLGEEVIVSAAPAEEGMGFFEWTGDTLFLASSRSPETTLQMPLEDLSITATYKALPKYELIVVNGSGSGKYLAGTMVRIEADEAPENMEFARWEGDTLYLSQTDTAIASVLIPEQAISLTASYQAAGISYSREVAPLLEYKCSLCHGSGSSILDLSTYENVKANAAKIKASVESGFMPLVGTLNQEQKDLIVNWVDQGAKNN